MVGENCNVLPSNHLYSPGCSGYIFKNLSGLSRGPPFEGPSEEGKKTVTGSYPLSITSGTTVILLFPII